MDTFNYLAATLCAVAGFAFVAWRQPLLAGGCFVMAVLNVGVAVFTP